MKKRSQPRYLVPEKRKRQPSSQSLNLTPEHPMRGWFRMVARFVVVSTAIPYLLFRLYMLALSPYRIHFDARPLAIKLDGRPIALDSADGFDLSRFTFGEHRLRYVDAGGHSKEVNLHPALGDGDGGLAISDSRVDGVPKAEFVRTP